ncbi:MAG: mandelate racemase/muconate lactonizing enzyme family protein [Caldilineaceae bacterium]|nr:mandelate racemase/muconate lactonizing enzyme family protein [Caldilineaceae bacterium]
MKITNIRTQIVGNPWKNWVFVIVETDEGITGLGEATGGLKTKSHEADVHEIGRFVIGEDPTQPERIWQKMHKGTFLGTGPAMSGIEMACWDILGKALNAPLWKLLGGKQRPKIRVYANGWYKGPREPQFFAERAAELAAHGYTALKFDPFGNAYRFFEGNEERKSLDIVAAVREAVGDNVDLCIEGHDRFSVATAVRVGRALADFYPMWFETPVMSTDIAGTVEVARAIDVPVATGERFDTLGQFNQLLSHRAVSIVQPETLKIGGVSGARKAAAVAESAEAFVALHQAQSPLLTAINCHIHATLPNFLIHEYFDEFLEPWAREILSGVPTFEDGYIVPGDAPGHGVTLDEAAAAQYPYGQNNFLRLFEEGWERRRNP